MKARLRYVRMAPKKMNLLASLVRRRSVPEALRLLANFPKKGASLLSDLIASAAANAEQQSQSRETLFVKYLVVQKGPGLKRSIPMARGRSRPINKWTSHVTVELGVLVPEGGTQEQPSPAAKGGKTKKAERAEKARKAETKKVETIEKVEGPEAPVSTPKAHPNASKGADPHGKGFSPKDASKGPTFQPHRRGGRGS